MADNKILPFAQGNNAFILSDADYQTDSERPIGNQYGIARPDFVNKALRQSSVMAAALAQFGVDNAEEDIDDSMSVESIAEVLSDAISKIIVNSRTPGEIGTFCFETPPAGWLLADGTEVSRTTYARLFAAIGTTFGAGDGSTTFKLPDLRGEFIRGADFGHGVDPDRVLGSAQGDAIRNITGAFSACGWVTGQGSGAFNKASATINRGSAAGSDWGNSFFDFDVSRVVTTAEENRPRNIALAMFIFAGV